MAEEQLKTFEAMAYPLMKDSDRQKIFSGYMMIIDSKHENKQVEASMAKLDTLKGKFGYKGKQ